MKLGMILTGGGSDVIPALLRAGGASSYFSFAEVPYSKESTAEILGYYPEKYSCLDLAIKFADEAFERLKYYHHDNELIAVGSTAKLFTRDQRPDRENIAWLVVRSRYRVIELGIKFLVAIREEQEKILANTIKAVAAKEFNFATKLSFLGDTQPGYICPRYAKLIHLRF